MTNLFYGKKTIITRALKSQGIKFVSIDQDQLGNYIILWKTTNPSPRIPVIISVLRAILGPRYIIRVDQASYNSRRNSQFTTKWRVAHLIKIRVEET